jgi:peptide alpha-N-acetyltransferase
MTWPQISFVAEDHKGRIVGYVLAKMCVSLPYDHELLSSFKICTETILQRKIRMQKYTDMSTPYRFYGHTGV